jgi:23S rRNA pseudouridine1911/1915/1917 synthase
MRLDRWLAARLPDLSRARLQQLIEQGRVAVEGRPSRSAARLKPGQRVAVDEPEPEPAAPHPEALPLAIVHEDAWLVVVDKPAGMVVHPGAGTPGGTLVNALLHHVRDLSGIGGVARPGIVHRLDKGTSGLIAVAKDDATHRALSRQFAGREVDKQYLAVVLGQPVPEGETDAPIGRDPVHRKRMAVGAPRARPARSSWRVEEWLDGAALVRVQLHTGRTHQVRVHLAALGHPLAGDPSYAGGRRPLCRRHEARAAIEAFPRPALHAARLGFVHPGTGRALVLESPLPPDLVNLVARLRLSQAAGGGQG